MSSPVKLTLYLVLAVLAGVSGYFALSNFSRMMARAGERTSDLELVEPERKPAEGTDADAASTNAAADLTATNAAVTNLAATVTTNASVAAGTNSPASRAATGTNQNAGVASGNAKKAKNKPSAAASTPGQPTSEKGGRIGVWAALFVVSILALGLLLANDVSHYFGNKALKALYNDEGDGQKDPDYEKAEETWANGEHLEAIGLMREYLAKNPRQQHVAIRIAEIYEKDLKNNLAAALEYEEVLKHKLPPERWAWAAVHLCNLYFRLSQEQKGYDLLRRIVKEHPATAAAEKARKRLEQVEGAPAAEQVMTEQQVSAPQRAQTQASSPGPPSHLPPGFRPKK